MTLQVKTAGMILGIVGGVIDAIIGLLCIVGGAFMGSILGGLSGVQGVDVPPEASGIISAGVTVVGVIILLVAVLAIVGGAITNKHAVVGGILMLIAGLLNFFGAWLGFIIALILIAGGVLALVGSSQEKAKAAPPAPAA